MNIERVKNLFQAAILRYKAVISKELHDKFKQSVVILNHEMAVVSNYAGESIKQAAGGAVMALRIMPMEVLCRVDARQSSVALRIDEENVVGFAGPDSLDVCEAILLYVAHKEGWSDIEPAIPGGMTEQILVLMETEEV